jgi:hypothetical protein
MGIFATNWRTTASSIGSTTEEACNTTPDAASSLMEAVLALKDRLGGIRQHLAVLLSPPSEEPVPGLVVETFPDPSCDRLLPSIDREVGKPLRRSVNTFPVSLGQLVVTPRFGSSRWRREPLSAWLSLLTEFPRAELT